MPDFRGSGFRVRGDTEQAVQKLSAAFARAWITRRCWASRQRQDLHMATSAGGTHEPTIVIAHNKTAGGQLAQE
ncbi:hypothetical protein GBAR_LOCUS17168 [Geodia barretti]|uniref:Uncharacterized protein n=1 Tax=Geodia barretti TaxID=519541 RepID=A0AA35SJR8_GEOBA|nr:hypothetical protein GBAR_LOCUS17168 [Geodia barretti]